MGFLTKTPGRMTAREAREVLDLHELVHDSRTHGPVTLERYARIRRCVDSRVDSLERNARRLVARLRVLGYCLDTQGDGETLLIDFAQDEALAGEVERALDSADKALNKALRGENDFVHDDADPTVPIEALRVARRHGLSVAAIARRFGIDNNKAQALVGAYGTLGCDPRRAGRARLEQRRSREAIERALAVPAGPGRVTAVARALGCHRHTARAVLRRLAEATPDKGGR